MEGGGAAVDGANDELRLSLSAAACTSSLHLFYARVSCLGLLPLGACVLQARRRREWSDKPYKCSSRFGCRQL